MATSMNIHFSQLYLKWQVSTTTGNKDAWNGRSESETRDSSKNRGCHLSTVDQEWTVGNSDLKSPCFVFYLLCPEQCYSTRASCFWNKTTCLIANCSMERLQLEWCSSQKAAERWLPRPLCNTPVRGTKPGEWLSPMTSADIAASQLPLDTLVQHRG